MNSTLRLFQALPHQCPYLPKEQAHNLIADPKAKMSTALYSTLIDLGFRRSGERVYRPNCSFCDACISTRILVESFQSNRSQRRCEKLNRDLNVSTTAQINESEYHDLYQRYISHRHLESEEMQNAKEVFEQFIYSSWARTFFIEFRLPNAELACVMVCDPLRQGWSAVYTFFDPELSHRSLGTNAIVWSLNRLNSLDLPYFYLGYWIEECQKMHYKTKFRPIQGYADDHWSTLNT